MIFSTAVLIGDIMNEETNVVNITQKLVKSPNCLDDYQIAICKT